MSKGSSRRPTDHKKFSEQWDVIFGIKKNPKTLEDHVWNDKMKDYQLGVDLAMIGQDKTIKGKHCDSKEDKE